ncbi:MAG TPA: serine/threonine-protein kinase [Acidobacteriaceae bacterium]|nr:serine/threonine-protein kinase [Acidobacteriaceae bacterium]
MIGERVGNFRITGLLGGGGMGTVYLAEHPGLGRRAAIKVLHAQLAADPEIVQRFFNEAHAANAVGHRGIVEVLDFGTLASGAPYIVMELLPGESLAGRLRRAGRLPIAESVDIADQVADAVGAAHRKGIVHRDLKPDNLFLTLDPERPDRTAVKVLDFGVAKLQQPPDGAGDLRTRTGIVMGTPQYMSPEQCRDARDVDHRADIYSLGVVLHEMLAGAPPFASTSWGELVHLHIGVAPPPLRACGVDVPVLLEAIVLQALAKDPAARFASVDDLRAALRAIGPGAPVRTLVMSEGGREISTPVAAVAPFATAVMPESRPRQRSTTLSETASEVEGRPAAGGRSHWVVAAAAAATLLAVLAVGVALRAPRRGLPVTSSATVSAPVTAPPDPLPITVEIVTEPVGASVVRVRDGQRLGTTPLQLSWPGATGVEPLDVQKEGYRSERVVVPLDRGITARLHLESLAAPAAAVAPSGGVETPLRRRPAPTPGHKKHLKPEPLKI